MIEQLSLFSHLVWTNSLKGHEADWLRANGFKNIYIDGYPPIEGIYEWVDINEMKIYDLKADSHGVYCWDSKCLNPCWWRKKEWQTKEES